MLFFSSLGPAVRGSWGGSDIPFYAPSGRKACPATWMTIGGGLCRHAKHHEGALESPKTHTANFVGKDNDTIWRLSVVANETGFRYVSEDKWGIGFLAKAWTFAGEGSVRGSLSWSASKLAG
jgi:hypothetical protein